MSASCHYLAMMRVVGVVLDLLEAVHSFQLLPLPVGFSVM